MAENKIIVFTPLVASQQKICNKFFCATFEVPSPPICQQIVPTWIQKRGFVRLFPLLCSATRMWKCEFLKTYWSSFKVKPIGHPQRRLFLFGKHKWEHPPRKPRRSTEQRFKNSGWRDEWYECISIGKCKSMWTFRKPFPVTLFAAEILFVFQSVQYSESSNSVKANGWGKWLLKICNKYLADK